ncbi:MAG TPA: hypothetical protein VMV81_10020 [Phycisphaerae bacterium]|nr:hypothetical protein [Phycisphaerae bacterium]
MTFIRMRSTLAFLALSCALWAGCNITPPPDTTTPPSSDNPLDTPQTGSPAANFDLNGSWRFAAAGGLGPGCITITSLRVATFDDGCSSNNLLLVNKPPAYTYDSHADVYCTYNLSANDSTNYGTWSFNLDLQADGSLSGLATRRLEPAGQVTSAQVIWVRQ